MLVVNLLSKIVPLSRREWKRGEMIIWIWRWLIHGKLSNLLSCFFNMFYDINFTMIIRRAAVSGSSIQKLISNGMWVFSSVLVIILNSHAPSWRLAIPLICYITESDCSMENGYDCPVEGIHFLVDMQKMEVVEFEYQ